MQYNNSNTNKGSGINTDEVFKLLSNSRRRAVIKLLERHGKLSKGDLAELIAAHEQGCSVNEVPNDVRKSVLVSLHQSHLTQLVESNVIEEDRDRYTLGENAGELLRHIELTPEETIDNQFLGCLLSTLA